MHTLKGIIWLIISLAIGCTNDAIMKYLGAVSINPWQTIFYRYLISTICLVPIICYKNKYSFKTMTPCLHALRGSILMIAMFLWNHGLALIPLSTATMLSFSVPIFVLCLAPFFLKEKMQWHSWIATVACLISAIIAIGAVKLEFNSAFFILIAAEILFAILDILYKKYLSKDSIIITLFYSSLVPTVITTIPALSTPLNFSKNSIIVLIALGIGSNLLLFCLLKAYTYSNSTSLAPFRYVELIISICIGYFIFSETPTLPMIIGGIIILLTNTLVSLYSRNK